MGRLYSRAAQKRLKWVVSCDKPDAVFSMESLMGHKSSFGDISVSLSARCWPY
jgi:hypothetical protein